VLILAERAVARGIKDAIAALPCLAKPGMGIMYSVPVEDFAQLGKRISRAARAAQATRCQIRHGRLLQAG
jgi:hypothetical protein